MKIRIYLAVTLFCTMIVFTACSKNSDNTTSSDTYVPITSNTKIENAGFSDIETIYNDTLLYANFNALRLYQSKKIPDYENADYFRSLVEIDYSVYTGDDYISFADALKKTATNFIFAKDYYNPHSTLYDDIPVDLVIFKSTASINFTPHNVLYINYTVDDRYSPKQEWIDYFNAKLLEEKGENNTPIIITESWSFNWNGAETTVVNASNIIDPSLDRFEYVDIYNVPPNPPLGENHLIYSLSAAFLKGDAFKLAAHSSSKVSSGTSLSFTPINNTSNDGYAYYAYSTYQYSGKEIIMSPVYVCFSGNSFANYLYEPLCFLINTDTTNDDELLVYSTGASKPLTSSLATYKNVDSQFERYTSIYPF